MAQSLSQLYVHCIFSTKGRKRFLTDPVLRERTHAYLVGICKKLDSFSIATGGTEDHVHILCRLSKNLTAAKFVSEVKRSSSIWIKREAPRLQEFYWQAGYGAFSISPSHVAGLRRYISNQEEHHRHETFQEEFRRLCEKYGVEIDERYVWD